MEVKTVGKNLWEKKKFKDISPVEYPGFDVFEKIRDHFEKAKFPKGEFTSRAHNYPVFTKDKIHARVRYFMDDDTEQTWEFFINIKTGSNKILKKVIR
jgi:hypothetical protein